MFFDEIFAFLSKTPYLCIVFFMVLDLRLMKIGLSGDNPSFFVYPETDKIRKQASMKRTMTNLSPFFYSTLSRRTSAYAQFGEQSFELVGILDEDVTAFGAFIGADDTGGFELVGEFAGAVVAYLKGALQTRG